MMRGRLTSLDCEGGSCCSKLDSQAASPFEWRILVRNELDTVILERYESGDATCFQSVRQPVVMANREECHDLIAILVRRGSRKPPFGEGTYKHPSKVP